MSDEEREQEVEKPPTGQRGTGYGIAWLAVLLSAVAVAAVGYSVFQTWRAASDTSGLDNRAGIESLGRRIGQSEEAMAALELRLEQIPHPDYSGEINAVRRDVDEQLQLLRSLPSRMAAIESSVASLAGISASARDIFLLAEAEYYLQIANAQLQLANNPHLAALALAMADERVVLLSNPALTTVRRAIANELTVLGAMEKPDIEGITLMLASLAKVVASLPLASASPQDADATEEVDPEQGNASRAWDAVKNAMSGLIKVTVPEQANLAMLSPNAESFLRNNVALQLQAARLALLRGEQVIFEQTLDDTSAMLGNYFDTSSAQVASAQQTIAEIRENVFIVAMPDISESLRLLQQFRTLSETAR